MEKTAETCSVKFLESIDSVLLKNAQPLPERFFYIILNPDSKTQAKLSVRLICMIFKFESNNWIQIMYLQGKDYYFCVSLPVFSLSSPLCGEILKGKRYLGDIPKEVIFTITSVGSGRITGYRKSKK